MVMETFMETYSVADTKTHLSELLTRVESGEEVLITRRGKVVARLSPERPKKKRGGGLPSMADLRAQMPMSTISSVDLVRQMRDEGY